MRILEVVAAADLGDWWIGAGFLRNTVWEARFGTGKAVPLNDIDVAYWKPLSSYGVPEAQLVGSIQKDESNPVSEEEERLAHEFQEQIPSVTFEVKNQARMHLWSARAHERKPYDSAADGIADWVETATAVGIRIASDGSLKLCAPWGIQDLVEGIVRPTRPELSTWTKERAAAKGWYTLWPELRFEEYENGSWNR